MVRVTVAGCLLRHGCCRCRSLRTPGNILVANLALSDFFMLAKTPVFIFNSFNLGPALGKTGCVIYGFVGGLTGATSIATLAAIALDRYWAVVRPLEPLRAMTGVRARLLAAGAWLYAAVFAAVPALDFGYGRYVPRATSPAAASTTSPTNSPLATSSSLSSAPLGSLLLSLSASATSISSASSCATEVSVLKTKSNVSHRDTSKNRSNVKPKLN
ncbi:hypothetical protein MSG28_002895 [Choristoneura fumiferana]|uniref:Uncharacterized protein n=1 Tax=Choristoneura fumiferana TaxID=7141 RepID=A0ACC0JJR9_CHOFU|nr:hypothetical protein MSG28_002895 [Choristoneura fumiferana]